MMIRLAFHVVPIRQKIQTWESLACAGFCFGWSKSSANLSTEAQHQRTRVLVELTTGRTDLIGVSDFTGNAFK